ncbi:MAG: transglutaminase-like domain-containing protein [bacterium]
MPRNISALVAMTMLVGLSCQKRSEVKTKPGKQGMLQPDGPRTTTPTRPAPRPRPAGTDPSRPQVGNNVLDLPTAAGVKALTAAEGAKLPYVQVDAARVVTMAKKHCKNHWYGLYLGGKKLGYAQMGCGAKTWKGREVLERSSRMVMQAQMYTTAVRLEIKTRVLFSTTGVGEMLRYEYTQSGAQQKKTLLVERKPDGWHILRTYQAGAIRKPPEKKLLKTIASNLTNGEAAYSTLLLEGKLRPGSRHRYQEFDPEDLKDRDTAAQLLATETRQLRGVRVKLHKLEMLELHRRLRGVTVVDDEANWLDGTLQGTIRIRREEKATAKRIDPKAGDFGLGVVIPAKMAVQIPSKVSQLRLQLSGFLPTSLSETKRHQLVKKSARLAELTITRESVAKLPTLTLPVTNKQFAKQLESTHNIEAKHAELQALARRAVGGETNALAAARKLNAFVFKYLRKSLSTNLDSALAIARARAGDCTEHARLMVALCRAVGLPAREVGGVTYVPDLGGFGYHAWVEVWVGRWITSDPSWNELPANATHIQMGGPDDVQWIGTLGALKLKVLGFQKQP